MACLGPVKGMTSFAVLDALPVGVNDTTADIGQPEVGGQSRG